MNWFVTIIWWYCYIWAFCFYVRFEWTQWVYINAQDQQIYEITNLTQYCKDSGFINMLSEKTINLCFILHIFCRKWIYLQKDLLFPVSCWLLAISSKNHPPEYKEVPPHCDLAQAFIISIKWAEMRSSCSNKVSHIRFLFEQIVLEYEKLHKCIKQ